jgi:GrpB-like predicted nucleotidyltransferase (UPF0157 family)
MSVVGLPDPSDAAAYDALLPRVTVGTPKTLSGPIVLRDYDPAWPGRYEREAEDGVNLHVFSAGCPETDRMVRFRDHLRSNAADRELYARTKRALAAREWKYMQQYADAKTEVVGEIMRRALAGR